MKILVKAANWLGDAVMSLPTLQSLRRMRPEDRITVMTKAAFGDLYRGSSAVDEVIGYEHPKGAKRIPQGMRLAKELRRHRFDIAILLPGSFSSALLVFTAGIPMRIGYAGDGRSSLLTHAMKKPKGGHHVLYYHHLLSVLGAVPEVTPPRIEIPPESTKWARSVLPAGRPLVAINPGATYGIAKQWPPDRFVQVARHLRETRGAEIVLVGGPAEASLAASLSGQIGGSVTLAGRTGILQLAAVLREADLLLTNDTGPMHVADAVGTPIVAIFGPTDPTTTAPFGSRHLLLRRPLECSPCQKRVCPLRHHHCMKWISVDEVHQACLRWLDSPRP